MMKFDFIKCLLAYKKIFIYGAGNNANIIYKYLIENKLNIMGFVVSDPKINPKTMMDLPVLGIEEYLSVPDSVLICSITYLGKGYNDIFNLCMERNINNIIFLNKDSFDKIFGKKKVMNESQKMNRLIEIFHSSGYKLIFKPTNEPNHTILEFKDEVGVYHWRIQNDLFYDFESMEDIIAQDSILQEFRKQYGMLRFLENKSNVVNSKLIKMKLYVVKSHVDKMLENNLNDDLYIPVQAGAVLTKKNICELSDAAGNNISYKNKIYSEATVIYWLWKNAPVVDYIGVCQYRRRLDINSNIEDLIRQYNVDIITSAPTFIACDVRTLFSKFLPSYDIDVYLQAIKTCAKEYYEAAEKFFASRFYPPCNLFIMRHNIFNEYSEIVFKISFWIEEYYKKRNIRREDRYMGFLIECFLGIFIMKHKEVYRSFCSDMIFLRSM